MDQGSTKKRSAVHNFVPTVTKFCVLWEGLSLPQDTKFGHCRDEIVDRRVIFIWSLIHGSIWSGLIKVGPVVIKSSVVCSDSITYLDLTSTFLLLLLLWLLLLIVLMLSIFLSFSSSAIVLYIYIYISYVSFYFMHISENFCVDISTLCFHNPLKWPKLFPITPIIIIMTVIGGIIFIDSISFKTINYRRQQKFQW